MKNTPKEKSLAQEKRVAKLSGGLPTIASGALAFQKTDVHVKDINMSIECKRTDKNSYALNIKTLRKLLGDARNRIPVLALEIQDESWYVIREEEFFLLLEYLRKLKDA